MTRTVFALGSLGAALLLTACNGSSISGGDNPGTVTPPPAAFAAAGSWAGTIGTPEAGSRIMKAVVTDDGSFWMVYNKADSGSVAGIVQGSGTITDGVYTVSGATLLSLEDNQQTTADLSADLVPQSSLIGTLTQAADGPAVALPTPAAFNALYQLASGQNLTLADLAGSYTGTITTKLGAESATVTIDDTGAITGSNDSGCTLTGQAEAQSQGNVFNVSVTFGSEDACALNKGVDVEGVVTLDVNKATAVAMDSAHTNSFIFTGLRP